MVDHDHGPLWERLREQESVMAEDRMTLSRHIGECHIRHAEIIRRQDEATDQRSDIMAKLDRFAADLAGVQIRMLTILLTVAGSAIVMIGGTVLQFVFRK
jgi:hypothetical protein